MTERIGVQLCLLRQSALGKLLGPGCGLQVVEQFLNPAVFHAPHIITFFCGVPDMVETDLLTEAIRRREALRAFMARHNLNPAEWAKRAGLPTANTLYNFLGGHTRTLNQATLEKLSRAVSGSSIQDIVGPDENAGATARVPLLPVRATAALGVWRPTYETAGGIRIELAIPPNVPADEAVQILDNHCDLIYPAGSCVCVQSLASLDRPLHHGDMVLVDAINEARQHEVTVRWVHAVKDNSLSLKFRCNSVPYNEPGIALPKPFEGQIMTLAPGVRGQIRGRVTMMVIMHDTRA
jgi:hypothetical protein